jgi:thiamine biosynthesis protein ThiI
MKEYLICHYAEIGLKGNNRGFFENQLKKNIRNSWPDFDFEKIKTISKRIILEIDGLSVEEKIIWQKKLKKIFGIAYFSFARESKATEKAMAQTGLKLLAEKDFNSFCVRVQRSDKDFPFTSIEMEKRIGALILKKTKKKVDLKNPDQILFVEIIKGHVFVYLEKILGAGGLPVGTAGRAICLLSDGIDSPVAAWQMMKRGLEIIFLHFSSYSKDEALALNKVKKIVKELNNYQGQSKLYLIPFKNWQQKVLKRAGRYGCLLCKRTMLELAERIAQKEKCFTLVTGDSLGQVASQTLENMRAIDKIVNLLILRPLIGFNKQEIINLAQKINTYNLSIIPTKFYCQDILPPHPITRANLEQLIKLEEEIEIETESIKKEILSQAQINIFH